MGSCVGSDVPGPATHNPIVNKASAVGDFFVNGTPPPRNGFL
jgi:hypothetical protein